jgi:phosphoglycerol transferase MdoB-like AlkP superfamily enzyme
MNATMRRSGAQNMAVALILAGLAWVAMAVQEVLLFFRPTPYGGHYVDHVWRYFPYALFYNVLGVLLASAPVLVFWLLCYGRRVSDRLGRVIHYVQLALLMLVVALDHADNEVMRFMGIHLTRSLVLTYLRVNAWGSDMEGSFATDRGGPWLPFVFLVLIPLLLWWRGRGVIRRAHSYAALSPLRLVLILILALLPVYMYTYHPMGQSRKLRVRPSVVTLIAEYRKDLASGERPRNLEDISREYQANWFSRAKDKAWRFTDPSHPLVRFPSGPAVAVKGKPWNVIYIQLETFRGWNTGFLRPDLKQSATPYLDSLAHDNASAYWVRHLSMGPPTVSGFVSGLCSIKPHSFYNITNSFSYTALQCLPALLRKHGYVAEYYTGFDPDWDGETVWLQRWFDDYQLLKGGGDRSMFQRSARRIRELGRGKRPFMVMIASASNHYPFRNKEPRYSSPPGSPPAEAIGYTMRYTDDALRQFIDSVRTESWFQRTLVIITGDHGYNLGEHVTAGLISGWRESVLVPLVIHGAHPRLPFGRHEEIASLLDIAPTVADLLGLRDPNPWMGASLLTVGNAGSFAMVHGTSVYGEQGPFSMVVDPTNGKTRLYDVSRDPLQRHDIAAEHRDIATALRDQAQREKDLTDYVLEANRVWPDSLVSGVSPKQKPAK